MKQEGTTGKIESCAFMHDFFYERRKFLQLYQIDAKYCRYLRMYDPLVPYNEGNKQRPFVGILVTIHKVHFYAPLTSPKPKHRHMRNELDFVKIDRGKLGALNLNNMIPVHPQLLQPISLQTSSFISKEEEEYHNLLQKQMEWCSKHEAQITSRARHLYQLVTSHQASNPMMKRCCNFYEDMCLLKQYCERYEIKETQLIKDIATELERLRSYRADHFRI